ncbi:MAG: multidrug efflux SMR transporter [Planctomycetaceae bacterium]|jgi:multidrug transporter EmrE-like cation transporter|nr:multidrug efflux SMR transporter [Planctomycetaceae bacterium]
MKNWLFLLAAIIAEVIGTSALKASEEFSKPIPSILVLLGYGISFYFLSLTLKAIPVGIAYAVWSGMGIVLISLTAWILFGQKIDGWGLLGMSLILIGVLILNLLSKTSNHSVAG